MLVKQGKSAASHFVVLFSRQKLLFWTEVRSKTVVQNKDYWPLMREHMTNTGYCKLSDGCLPIKVKSI